MLPYVIEVDGEFAGQLTIGNVTHGALRSAWIGYWVATSHIGGGVATAALALGLDHCFGQVRLHRVEATVRPENAASRAVLAKAGFREEGLLRRYLDVDGGWRDHLLVAITVEEVQGSVTSLLSARPRRWACTPGGARLGVMGARHPVAGSRSCAVSTSLAATTQAAVARKWDADSFHRATPDFDTTAAVLSPLVRAATLMSTLAIGQPKDMRAVCRCRRRCWRRSSRECRRRVGSRMRQGHRCGRRASAASADLCGSPRQAGPARSTSCPAARRLTNPRRHRVDGRQADRYCALSCGEFRAARDVHARVDRRVEPAQLPRRQSSGFDGFPSSERPFQSIRHEPEPAAGARHNPADCAGLSHRFGVSCTRPHSPAVKSPVTNVTSVTGGACFTRITGV